MIKIRKFWAVIKNKISVLPVSEVVITEIGPEIKKKK